MQETQTIPQHSSPCIMVGLGAFSFLRRPMSPSLCARVRACAGIIRYVHVRISQCHHQKPEYLCLCRPEQKRIHMSSENNFLAGIEFIIININNNHSRCHNDNDFLVVTIIISVPSSPSSLYLGENQ